MLSLLTRRGAASTGDARGAQFASKFGDCQAHRREAKAVHRAIEELSKRPLPLLDPDSAIADLVPGPWASASGSPPGSHAPDPELLTLGQLLSHQALVIGALKRHIAERILKTLLGPAAKHCTWDADTIAARSVRGLVTERVRCLGGCDCRQK